MASDYVSGFATTATTGGFKLIWGDDEPKAKEKDVQPDDTAEFYDKQTLGDARDALAAARKQIEGIKIPSLEELNDSQV